MQRLSEIQVSLCYKNIHTRLHLSSLHVPQKHQAIFHQLFAIFTVIASFDWTNHLSDSTEL